MKARIYHNPKCGKSRAALALLRDREVDLEIVEYLVHPPTKDALAALVAKLDADDVARLVRGEDRDAKRLAKGADVATLVELIAANPRELERPIVEVGERAIIGRPPERVLELIE